MKPPEIMCNHQRTVANSGIAQLSVANPNLDGTGPIVPIMTAGNSGTVISRITIKAAQSVAEGIVRLFVNDGSNYFLIREIMVEATTPTGVVPSFSAVLTEPFTLESGFKIGASTQRAERYDVMVEGEDWINCPCTGIPS